MVAEHDSKTVSPGTLSTITAASQISKDITVLLMGKGLGAVAAQAATISGVSKVKVADSDVFQHILAEDAAALVRDQAPSYSHILAPSSNNSKNFMPRAAAMLPGGGCSPLGDVIKVVSEDTFARPVYAGNAIATVQMAGAATKVLLIRPTAFEKAALGEQGKGAPIEAVSVAPRPSPSSAFVSASSGKAEGRVDLGTARVVVSGGRGMKSGDNFHMLDTMAAKLGGAVGASRAAVDAGFVPNDYQVRACVACDGLTN